MVLASPQKIFGTAKHRRAAFFMLNWVSAASFAKNTWEYSTYTKTFTFYSRIHIYNCIYNSIYIHILQNVFL